MPKPKTTKIPKPPDFLKGTSLTVWHDFAPRLFSAGLLDELSASFFGFFCQSYSMYQESFQTVAELKSKPDTDTEILKVWESILNDNWGSVVMLGKEFYLVPDDDHQFLILLPINMNIQK